MHKYISVTLPGQLVYMSVAYGINTSKLVQEKWPALPFVRVCVCVCVLYGHWGK